LNPRHEPKARPPIPRHPFVRRVLLHAAAALVLLLFSLMPGMLGYEHFEQLPWRDAFLNSAMLMGGMGPVDAPLTDGGKVFVGLYALYAGMVFFVAGSLLFAPIVHRLMHKFHWEQDARQVCLTSMLPGFPSNGLSRRQAGR
jgi:hypothetical protein